MNKEDLRERVILLMSGLFLSALIFTVGMCISPKEAVIILAIITLIALALVTRDKEIKYINLGAILILLPSSLLISFVAFEIRISIPPGISAGIILSYLAFSGLIGAIAFFVLMSPSAYATTKTGGEKLSIQLPPLIAAISFIDLMTFAILNIKNDFIILLALTIALNTVIGIILVVGIEMYYEKIYLYEKHF